jgi:hypothetical protein
MHLIEVAVVVNNEDPGLDTSANEHKTVPALCYVEFVR